MKEVENWDALVDPIQLVSLQCPNHSLTPFKIQWATPTEGQDDHVDQHRSGCEGLLFVKSTKSFCSSSLG